MARSAQARWAVPTLFALVAFATALGAARPVSHAFVHPGASSVLAALYGVLRTLIAVAFMLLTVGREPARRRARSPLAFAACALALSMAVVFRPPPPGTPEALEVFGEGVAVAACTMLALSLRSLGRCFGVLPEARGLVTTGAYSVVRHPLYAAEIATFAGLAVAAPTLTNGLLVVALTGAQLVRIWFEQRALTAAFREYEWYARTVPALVPSPRALFAVLVRALARRQTKAAAAPSRI
jgi:protein-S-isoprenylcysteine O-methyltransferase Ste14